VRGVIVFSKIISFIGYDVNIAIGIGWWLLTFGAIAILVGAFKLQKELLEKVGK